MLRLSVRQLTGIEKWTALEKSVLVKAILTKLDESQSFEKQGTMALLRAGAKNAIIFRAKESGPFRKRFISFLKEQDVNFLSKTYSAIENV